MSHLIKNINKFNKNLVYIFSYCKNNFGQNFLISLNVILKFKLEYRILFILFSLIFIDMYVCI